MATTKKNSNRNGVWKKERASVSNNKASKPKSNKYRPASDGSKHPAPGTGARYWRGGYTRSDGTKVKGHYVNKSK